MLSTNCSGSSSSSSSIEGVCSSRSSRSLSSISHGFSLGVHGSYFQFQKTNFSSHSSLKTLSKTNVRRPCSTHTVVLYYLGAHSTHIYYLIQLIAADVKQYIVLSNVILKLKKSPPKVFPNRLMSILLASHNKNCCRNDLDYHHLK